MTVSCQKVHYNNNRLEYASRSGGGECRRLNRAVLAEGLAFAAKMGLDASSSLEILRVGPAYSQAMDVKGDKMLARDFAPQARLAQHLKDIRLILESGDACNARLPFSARHRELMERLVADGLGDADNSAVILAFD